MCPHYKLINDYLSASQIINQIHVTYYQITIIMIGSLHILTITWMFHKYKDGSSAKRVFEECFDIQNLILG